MCSAVAPAIRHLPMARRVAALLFLTGALALAACSKRPGDTVGMAHDSSLTGDTSGTKSDDSEISSTMGERDYRTVAEKVVGQSARVREGDIVLINGSDEDLPLLEDVAIEVQKRGGSPLVTVSTIRQGRRSYDEVPAKYDSVPSKALLKLASVINVYIGTESFEQRTLKGVPAERLAARGKAASSTNTLMQKRGVRAVFLGNGLYPSGENADQFKVSRSKLADMLYGGVDVDYAELQRTGEEVRRVLGGGKEVHITAPNGTDLRVQIAGRPVFVSDGIISPQDERRGSPATAVWLPAGEVYLVPVPGTAEGVVVADQDFFQGQRIDGLRLEFKGGKLTSMTAKSGLDPVKEQYDAGGAGRDALGVLDLGINPGLKLPSDKPIHPWSRAGMTTVSVGNNMWAGGNNNSQFGLAPHLPNATVAVDGKVLIQDGKLIAGDRVALR
jgi:aminopeptidase